MPIIMMKAYINEYLRLFEGKCLLWRILFGLVAKYFSAPFIPEIKTEIFATIKLSHFSEEEIEWITTYTLY
jgi:hypothetical protein